jgi:hypothetical protein
MARIYVKYGPPDQIEDRTANGQNLSQIWRYNYLEDFHSNVELEISSGRGFPGVRVNWPPPLATYWAPPDDGTRANHGGLKASIQTYPAGMTQVLSVSLDLLSGPVLIMAQITTVPSGGETPQVAAALEDRTQAPTAYQAGFILPAGAYVCGLIVGAGRPFTATIHFEVK